MEKDAHFLLVCRYVERNALTAGLVRHAEDWRWSSLWARRHGEQALKAILSDWPLQRPRHWLRLVNQALTAKEAEGLDTCIARNRPFGSQQWQSKQARRLGLLHTLRAEGRPKAAAAGRRGKN